MARKVRPKNEELFTIDDLYLIRKYPHILGHLAGYNLLTELHSEWIHYLFEKDKQKVRALWCHRGSYKSTALAVGIVWRWLFFPEDTILLVRKDFSTSTSAIKEIGSIMKLPEIRELFYFAHGEYPEMKQEKYGDALLDFTFRKKPSMGYSIKGGGANSNYTGLHYNIILIDDLSNLKSRVSKAERTHDQSIYREVVTNVQNRGDDDTGFTRIVATPWVPFGQGGIEDLHPEPRKYTLEDTNLISPIQLEEIRKSTTPQLFAANYLMEFVSNDMAVFKDPVWGTWQYQGIESPRAQIDLAYSKDGDHTAVTIAAKLPDGRLQAVGFLYKGNGIEWIDAITDTLRLYKVRKIYIEENTDKGWGAKLFKEKGFAVTGYAESQNKGVKIGSYGLEMWNKTIWAEETDTEYMNQILDWQDVTGNNPDDAPDSYASLIRACYSKKGANNERWKW